MSNYLTDYAKGDQGGENWHAANVDPSDMPVPDDLKPYYQQNGRNGTWVYVCPFCKHIFKPFWGGMPDAFRYHMSAFKPDDSDKTEYERGGCFLRPPRAKQKGKYKSTSSSLTSLGGWHER